jgi:CheY-like chemotaxis protein
VTPKHVLVVEDHKAVRESLLELLRGLGYTAVGLDDGARALPEIARRRPDVILLDLIMPRAELDGLAFLSTLAISRTPDIPIIIISGLGASLVPAIPETVKATLRIAAILPKPIDIETLMAAVARVVGRHARP